MPFLDGQQKDNPITLKAPDMIYEAFQADWIPSHTSADGLMLVRLLVFFKLGKEKKTAEF